MEKIIGDNTMYYFFSTVAQVMAAIAALLTIFIQFKITELKEFLVGDGLAIYKRKINYDNKLGDPMKSYGLMREKITDRLYDANARKDLYNIEKIILEMAKLQEKNNEIHETGFRGLYERFIEMKSDRKKLIYTSRISVILSMLTIVISLLVLTLIDLIKDNDIIKISLIILTFTLVIISLVFVVQGIYLGLEEKVYTYDRLD